MPRTVALASHAVVTPVSQIREEAAGGYGTVVCKRVRW